MAVDALSGLEQQLDGVLAPLPDAAIGAAVEQRQRRGVFTSVRVFFFGERDESKEEVRRLANHGAGLMATARAISRPLMILFSLGALIVFSSDAIKNIVAAFTGKGAFDPIQGATVIVLYGLIFGADIAMIVAAVRLYDALTRGKMKPENYFDAVVLVGVGVLEAVTLALMTASVEHPKALGDWTLIALRSAMAPVVAIYLALLYPRQPTDDDYKHVLGMRAGERLLKRMESSNLADDDLGKLYMVVALANGANEQSIANMNQLIDVMNELAPSAIRREAALLVAQRETELRAHEAELREHIAQLREETAEVIATKEREMNDLYRQLQEAVRVREYLEEQQEETFARRLKDTLITLAFNRRLPDDLIEQYPELERVNLDALGVLSNGKTRAIAAPKTQVESKDSADGQRAFLRRILGNPDQESRYFGTPKGKKGVWVLPRVIPTLSGDNVTESAAQRIVQSLGNGAKVGVAYAAPFQEVMRHLFDMNALGNEARSFWKGSGDSGDNAVDIDGESTEKSA